MGQLRPHPLLAIEQALRREVAQGLDRLQLSPAQRSHYLAIGRDGRIIEE